MDLEDCKNTDVQSHETNSTSNNLVIEAMCTGYNYQKKKVYI